VLAMYNFLHIHELNLYFVYILNCRSSFQLIGCPYYIASEVLQKCCEQEADVKPTRVVIYVFLSYIAPFEQVSLLFLAVIFKLNYSTESKLIIKYDLFYHRHSKVYFTQSRSGISILTQTNSLRYMKVPSFFLKKESCSAIVYQSI
jgi:hypothetical protein